MQAKIVAIIQARLYSTRLPGKSLMTVGGIPMVKRVWLAAKRCGYISQTIVAWPERYPDLDENNVLERFRRIANETGAEWIVRLTSDCPLLSDIDIYEAFRQRGFQRYYNNYRDGHDVQIIHRSILFDDALTDREHVIKDTPSSGGDSVNTKEDLERARTKCRIWSI